MLTGTVEVTFLILMVVVVFAPVIAERLRLPAIVGLIFGGTLFGPFVLGWLAAGGLVAELGAIGILYLMFLAGVGFDLQAFTLHRRSALTYGLLGFLIPFVLSFVVAAYVFNVGALAAALIGAMWASNTLVAYGEVQSAGLQSNRAVSASVSAGVVADLLSLTVLAIVTSTVVIESDPLSGLADREFSEFVQDRIAPSTPDPKFPLYIALPLLAAFCLWLLPRLTEAFFVRVGRSRMQRFVFALVGMGAGASLALLGGVEGLIGAFLAGLGMNRLIPASGPLMGRIEFVGAAIFVPTFLVSIGLNIDPALLVDPSTLLLGLAFTGFVVVGKTIAAGSCALIFGFTPAETGLMSSLSFGQAASTLAIAQVGLDLGMFEPIVVNASVIAIVLTALITSYGTRFFARSVPPVARTDVPVGEHVMLDVRAGRSDLDGMVRLASAVARPDRGMVSAYLVTEPGSLDAGTALVDRAVVSLSGEGVDAEGRVRIDESFAAATVHLVEERAPSSVILSWKGPRFASDYLFGNEVDGIGGSCPVTTIAAHLVRPWEQVAVVVGSTDTAARRADTRLAVSTALRLRGDEEPLLVVTSDPDEVSTLVREFSDSPLVGIDLSELQPTDLVVVPAHVLQRMNPRTGWRTAKQIDELNLVVVAGPYRLTVSKGVARDSLPQASATTRFPVDPS